MTLVLFLFYLVYLPRETYVCSLWVSRVPSSIEVAEACGRIELEQHTVKIINLNSQTLWCEKNGTAVYAPAEACDLKGISLDNFRMDIYRQVGEQAVCSITTTNQSGPELYEIRAACPADAVESYFGGQAVIRFVKEIQPTAPALLTIPAPEPGPGLFDQTTSPDDLHTDIAYTWLAGRLIWHAYVIPDCDGYSGLDPLTLTANGCGLASAAEQVRAWQNQFDADIHAAALAEGIPARLLKRVIAVETQFWPYYDGPVGETGLAQVTRAAVDQALRIYQSGYYQLTPEGREMLQASVINGLRCNYCTVEQSIEQERRNIQTYARMLKAYRATSTDWYGALVAWNGEAYAQRVAQ